MKTPKGKDGFPAQLDPRKELEYRKEVEADRLGGMIDKARHIEHIAPDAGATVAIGLATANEDPAIAGLRELARTWHENNAGMGSYLSARDMSALCILFGIAE